MTNKRECEPEERTNGKINHYHESFLENLVNTEKIFSEH